ncbi:Phage-related lysozyme (muraminidase) (COG3772) [uncultured Mediterranean phage uvMED]|nr:Phage-related lysozyme (muraminidase) (COG3772) [uncultured Mediterranean phage uvMED]
MNIERLKKQVIANEGMRKTAYKDTLDNWTTGVGHLIRLPDEEYLIEKELTDIEVDQIFTTDLNQAIDDARKFIDADTIPEEAFEVVIDMAFNLGLPRLMKFQNFQQALKEKDYKKASREMLDSVWAKQLPNRSKRLAKQMREV